VLRHGSNFSVVQVSYNLKFGIIRFVPFYLMPNKIQE
jgi:hypothetical protein